MMFWVFESVVELAQGDHSRPTLRHVATYLAEERTQAGRGTQILQCTRETLVYFAVSYELRVGDEWA